VFDAADGFSTCTRRLRSNTPLQALTLLNDQQFYEMAEALAKRAFSLQAANERERITRTFLLCLGRKPSTAEEQRLELLLNEQMKQEPGNEQAKRTAAWTTMARVLLNLDEAITRE
jgi:hypothetical protein